MIVRGLFAPISWAYLLLGELTGVPDGWGAVIMDARMLGQVDIIIVGMISIGIYVMTAAPGCILEEVALDLPRPCIFEVRATLDFLAVKRKLVTLLERARAGGRPLEIIPACSAETGLMMMAKR